MQKTPKTIAIIPARGGSKRLPKKNVMPLGDLPLIAHSIAYAKANSAIIDAVYVSTDCAEIKAVAEQYGAIVIDRPDAISGDYEPTITALQHVLESLEFDVEHVCLLQATNPLRPERLLENAFKIYEDGAYDSLMTVSQNFHKLGKIENHRFVPYNYEFGQRSQDIAPLYYENGLLYITKAKQIKAGHILAEHHHAFVVSHPYAEVDIDTYDDFKYAEYFLK